MESEAPVKVSSRGVISTLVSILVITAILIIVVEMGFRIIRMVIIDPAMVADQRVNADGYSGKGWVEEYFKEVHSIHTVWKSYVYWRSGPFNGKYINIDENGVRRTWNPKDQNSDDKKRILAMGGSTMWGFGARDYHTIPSYLSKLVHQSGHTIYQVINMGDSGYVSSQELMALYLRLRKGDIPDIVIFYDGVNDIFSAYQNKKAGVPQNEINRRLEFNLLSADTKTIMSIYGPMFLRRTATFKTLREIALGREMGSYHDWTMGLTRAPIDRTAARNLGQSVARIYYGNMKIVQALADSYGFKVRFYWQPTIYQKGVLSDYEKSVKERMKPLAPLFKEAYNEALSSGRTNGPGRNFKDLSNVFQKVSAPIFIDFCHVTEKGNEFIAKNIFDDLKPLIEN